jgi:heme exporter protein CcmD
MEQGRYGAYVLAAYLISALVIAAVTAFAAIRARRTRRRLLDAEKRIDG